MCLLAAEEPGAGKGWSTLPVQLCCGCGQDVGELRSRAEPPAPGWTAAALTLIAGRRVAKKINPANSTGPAQGAAGGGGEQPAPPRASAPALWGGKKPQPAMAFCQHRSPAAAKRACCWDPWDSPGWAKHCYPTVIPEHFTRKKKCSTRSLYGGKFVVSLPFCPSNPLPHLKHLLQIHVSPSGSWMEIQDRKQTGGTCTNAAACREGEESSQREHSSSNARR